MKIAIHHRPNSFSDRWIEFCKAKGIPYKIVNAFDTDIINQLKDCNAFMWHHHHADYKDVLVAKKILFSIEHAGLKVFPNFNTSWHFDDKVAQKYLLEAIDAPLVSSYVFYNKKQAITWAKDTSYPKVWKLKGGAGSANVELINSFEDAIKYINRAFGKGFSQFNRWRYIKDRFLKFASGQISLLGAIKSCGRLIFPTDYSKKHPSESNYIYFQDFIPNNTFDIRVIVIGKRAFAIKRMVRRNDFRASGGGNPKYDRAEIDERCIEIAFTVNRILKTQSIAYDFVFDESNSPLIVEIGYGFSIEPYDKCPGYWDDQINWHEGTFKPQEWMVEELLK